MSRSGRSEPPGIEPLDPRRLETLLREAARRTDPHHRMQDLEVSHLVRVVKECSLLLSDVYSDDRIARIMSPEGDFVSRLVERLIDRRRRGEGEVLYRIRRLPYDVRVVGDKALFDVGLLGLSSVKGYDLAELGSRAYRVAGEALQLLATDRELREFFKQNRLLMLPLESEVDFLHRCSERFEIYADILKRVHLEGSGEPGPLAEIESRVPLMAAAVEALGEAAPARDGEDERGDPYLVAARGDAAAEGLLSRDELISVYERIVLFSALDMKRLRDALASTVVDQQSAVDALCDEFSLFAAGTRDLRRPPAYFLVGPTGVGKNHLVETLRRVLEGVWGVELPMLTIEGPNYTYPSDINELRGATRGFIRSDEEGLLTAFHEKSSRSPLALILVDEVEKAHVQLRRFFLSILDRGTTTDNRGQTLNLANCLVFFTSNIGYSDSQQRAAPIGYNDEESKAASVDQEIRRGLHRALSPEFMNRVRLVHFERLTRASVERILDLELEKIRRRYVEVHGLDLELDESARAELIRQGFSPEFGARHLSATLERVCNVEIAKKIRRDDRLAETDRREIVEWLRDVRSGRQPFDPEEARRRVLEVARARLDYQAVRIVFADGEFDYVPVVRDEDDS